MREVVRIGGSIYHFPKSVLVKSEGYVLNGFVDINELMLVMVCNG